ncbi:MAG: amidohydrolase family protein, partial [Hyphomicrobiales bacterium]|nr:amidohydrolase family protein [Hyphomicrobiales bacterium]
FDGALIGGSLAAGRNSGSIETGKLADLIALDDEAADLYLKENDMILDSYIFASDDRCISDVWSAGRHMVTGGRHITREKITTDYKKTMASLKDRI